MTFTTNTIVLGNGDDMTATTTKKLLVSFDASKPDGRGGAFVVPVMEGEKVFLLDLQSRRQSELAMMVFVGREVSENDLFAKLVDTGQQIGSVDETLKVLSRYVASLSSFKIGNVLSIEPADKEDGGFRLVRFADSPSAAVKALS